MAVILNGRLDGALLSDIPNGKLRHDAADSWRRVLADGVKQGYVFVPSGPFDSYRPYWLQERIFRERYTTEQVTGIDPRQWLGLTWWRKPGTHAAAVPGQSNHGWAVAIDVAHLGGFTGSKYRALERIATRHGWDNNEGRSVNEPWHWVYKPENDHGRPAPAPEEEDDMPYSEEQLRRMMRDAITERLPQIVEAVRAHEIAERTREIVDAVNLVGSRAQVARDQILLHREAARKGEE